MEASGSTGFAGDLPPTPTRQAGCLPHNEMRFDPEKIEVMPWGTGLDSWRCGVKLIAWGSENGTDIRHGDHRLGATADRGEEPTTGVR